MIDNVNDDCQFIIINYLNYSSQFWLWVASKDFAPRLHRNVSYILQRKTSHALDYYHWFGEYVHNPTELEDDFLRTISSTVEHLDLKSVNLKNLECLMKHSFPCIRSLHYRPDKVDGTEHDEALELLVKLFPGLTSFKPFGPVDGGVIEKLKNLRKLDLSRSSLFNTRLSLRTFQELEHLVISLYFFKGISIETILNLPKLRSFSFSTESTQNKSILSEIIEQRGLDIRELSFRFIDWSQSLDKLKQLKNLRQLMLMEDSFKKAHFQAWISNLPELEQLNMVGGQFWYYERDLWKAVASCSSLKILNFSDTLIDDEFYDSSRHHMEEALNNRSQPLLLHCYNTGEYDRDTAECQQLHLNLIVSFKELKVDDIPFQYTKIVFA
ncbi:uncharacterized protein LOC111602463 isoform X2 [Drosophila hydei]|uniref:Uncharacterized protein LOC111602463 isoform X2 n=1 Tax=Drosophila hydei TaxID=7224 RepID=A0A6J2SSH1_DROHY|nr:uncharacterized protein LOC111602463 isoform X2 [Drosophila hydei]